MIHEKIFREPDISKYKNVLLSFKEITKDKAGDQWRLGKPGDVCPEYFLASRKTDSIGLNGNKLNAEDRCADLYQYLWFIIGKSMGNNNHNFFE